MKIEKIICDVCGANEETLPVVVVTHECSELKTSVNVVKVKADLCHWCAVVALRDYMDRDGGALFNQQYKKDIEKNRQANKAKGDI